MSTTPKPSPVPSAKLRVLISTILLLSFGSLDTTAQELTLEPSSCGVEGLLEVKGPKGLVCGLPTQGLRTPAMDGLSLPIGYDNWQRGPRRRCKEGVSWKLTSHVAFDLRSIPRGARIVAASLRFEAITPRGFRLPSGPVNDFHDYGRDHSGSGEFVSFEDNCRERKRKEEPFWEELRVPERYRGIARLTHNLPHVSGRIVQDAPSTPPRPVEPVSSVGIETFEFDGGRARVDVTAWLRQRLAAEERTIKFAFRGYDRLGERTRDRCVSALLPESLRLEVKFEGP